MADPTHDLLPEFVTKPFKKFTGSIKGKCRKFRQAMDSASAPLLEGENTETLIYFLAVRADGSHSIYRSPEFDRPELKKVAELLESQAYHCQIARCIQLRATAGLDQLQQPPQQPHPQAEVEPSATAAPQEERSNGNGRRKGRQGKTEFNNMASALQNHINNVLIDKAVNKTLEELRAAISGDFKPSFSPPLAVPFASLNFWRFGSFDTRTVLQKERVTSTTRRK